jgi:RNA polymerase sigma-70 factor (ECF subfamily)
MAAADQSTVTFRSFWAAGTRRFARTASTAARLDERVLAAAILHATRGNRSALHYLYVCFAHDVRRHVKSIVRHDDAEDITQDVFLKLPTAIRKYEPRGIPFRAWILRVARNAALDHARAQRLVPCDEIEAGDNGHERVAVERRLALREAIEMLPVQQREVLLLRQVAGFGPRQTAELLGKSEGSVRGLHHRGRGALQAALRELEMAPVTARCRPAGG